MSFHARITLLVLLHLGMLGTHLWLDDLDHWTRHRVEASFWLAVACQTVLMTIWVLWQIKNRTWFHLGVAALALTALEIGVIVAGFWVGETGYWKVNGKDLTMPLLVVIVSQSGLLAIWSVFGGRPGPWRLVAVFAVLTVYLALLGLPSHSGRYREAYQMLAIFFVFTPALCVGLLGLRWSGVAIGRNDRAWPPVKSDRRLQFTLGSMLAWIAAIAVMMGLLSLVVKWPTMRKIELPPRSIKEYMIGLPTLAVLVGLSPWIALAEKHRLFRALCVVLCPSIILAAVYGSTIRGAIGPAFTELLIVVFGVATSTIVSLLLLRSGGLRVTWIWRRAAPDEANGEHASSRADDVDPFEDSV